MFAPTLVYMQALGLYVVSFDNNLIKLLDFIHFHCWKVVGRVCATASILTLFICEHQVCFDNNLVKPLGVKLQL